MHHSGSSRSFFFVLALLSLATSLLAFDGRIAGRVSRPDGSGVGGVSVQPAVVGNAASAVTDAGGFYLFAVEPGTYTLRFQLNFNEAFEPNVVVVSGQQTTVNKQVDWPIGIAETSSWRHSAVF